MKKISVRILNCPSTSLYLLILDLHSPRYLSSGLPDLILHLYWASDCLPKLIYIPLPALLCFTSFLSALHQSSVTSPVLPTLNELYFPPCLPFLIHPFFNSPLCIALGSAKLYDIQYCTYVMDEVPESSQHHTQTHVNL